LGGGEVREDVEAPERLVRARRARAPRGRRRAAPDAADRAGDDEPRPVDLLLVAVQREELVERLIDGELREAQVHALRHLLGEDERAPRPLGERLEDGPERSVAELEPDLVAGLRRVLGAGGPGRDGRGERDRTEKGEDEELAPEHGTPSPDHGTGGVGRATVVARRAPGLVSCEPGGSVESGRSL